MIVTKKMRLYFFISIKYFEIVAVAARGRPSSIIRFTVHADGHKRKKLLLPFK
jgi:hypothetical protein